MVSPVQRRGPASDALDDPIERFDEHLRRVCDAAAQALDDARAAGCAFDGIVLHAGTEACYHADDRVVPFRSTPHFRRFAPVEGPGHLLLFRPGERPRLAWVDAQSHWEEPAPQPEAEVRAAIDTVPVPAPEAARPLLGDLSGVAYLGDDPELARHLGVPQAAVEPPPLVAALDWQRAFKTPFEVDCIRAANRLAGRGHAVARAGFEQRESERRIHARYLEATGALELETPYPNIIAWDDRGAILHYQRKRDAKPSPGNSFLIDAGASVRGYASDVTRSYAHPEAHPVFREALDRMETLQQSLCEQVAPGLSFVALHERAVHGVAAILCELGVLRCGVDEAVGKGLALPFLPHGLGHHLGLQVHDVGGRQESPTGGELPPPEAHPYLRTTRTLAPGHVVTIEPGLYLIPRLLGPLRAGPDASSFHAGLLDELIPCGGIRIEDDVLVTEGGCENLTRPWVPGHRSPSVPEPGESA